MARSRQHERIQRNDKDDDTIYKFLRIVKKYFPSLMNEFRKANSTDPRKKNYLRYSLRQHVCCFLFLSPEAKFGPQSWDIKNKALKTAHFGVYCLPQRILEVI